MKRLLLAVLFTLLLVSCYNAERNCTDFRTGTFEFKQEVNGKELSSKFTRTEEMEIDYFEGKADSSSIRWINDCEFIVSKMNPKSNAEKKSVHMKILTTSKNSYTFEYSIVGDSKNKKRGTATKINQ